MEDAHTIKMAMVAAVTKALEFKRKYPSKSDYDAISHIVSVSDQILDEMN